MPRLRLRRTLSLALFLLPALTVGAVAAPSPSALSGIRAAYDQIYAACRQRDPDRILSFLAPDYAVVNEKGERTDRAQVCRDCRERMGKVLTLKGRYTLGRVSPAPGGVWVEMRMHTEGVGEKRLLFARLRASFTSDLSARDLWVPTPQGWRLKFRQVLQNETHIQ